MIRKPEYFLQIPIMVTWVKSLNENLDLGFGTT